MRRLTSFAFFLLASILQAQEKACQIINPQGQAVPYVNIYSPGLQNGLVAGADGRFFFQASDFGADDTLVFSCIGYQTLKWQASQFNQLSPCQITLQPRTYETATAEITEAPVSFKKRSAGVNTRWKLFQFGYGITQQNRGGEVGLFFPNTSTCILEQVGFNIAHAQPDSVLLEVNIYEAVDSLPGRPLQQARIFTHAVANQATVVDLSNTPVWVDGDFFVTLEFLHGRAESKGIVLFKAKRKSKYLTLVRKANGTWEQEAELSPAIHAKLKCISP